MTFTSRAGTAGRPSPSTLVLAFRAAWSVYCVTRSARELRAAEPISPSPTGPRLAVLIPLLDEAENVPALVEHWSEKLASSARLVLCVCTTERETIEANGGPTPRTWDVLAQESDFVALQQDGRAHLLHHPTANRTYGEQLSWAIDHLVDEQAVEGITHIYVANVDTRLSDNATNDLLRHVDDDTPCAQQSALFFGNLSALGGPAAAEALYQSRWTLEREYFRYLAGSGRLRWLPAPIARRWYQHAVGHGLLLSTEFIKSIGGLPVPRHGLEDAALGFRIRAMGHAIQPLATLECGDAPTSIRELQRQRMTWIRGPLCVPEYHDARHHPTLVAQGLYDAAKWALGLPLLAGLLARKAPTDRVMALAALAVELYGPAVATIAATQRIEIDQRCRPSPTRFVKALAWYPTAPANYSIGGLRGLVSLLMEFATRSIWTQPRTRDVTTPPTTTAPSV